MPAYYLVPVTSQTTNGQTVSAPEYFGTFFTAFSAIPYGLEPLTLLALASDNGSLDSAADVFAFPSDLTATLTDDDVTNATDFFNNANIPSDFLVTGALWNDVLSQVAQIFLLAQALAGSTGQPIFAGTSLTLDSTVATQSQGKGKTGNVDQQTPNAVATAAGSTAGVFDLSDVQDSDTISDTLTNVSQQFIAPIAIGGGTL